MENLLDALKEKDFTLFPECFDRDKKEKILHLPFYNEMLGELLEFEKSIREKDFPSMPFSLFRLFDETGDREKYQEKYFLRRKIANTYALLYLIYGKEEYLLRLEDCLWEICGEYTWCLPAHLGSVLEYSPEHKTVLDLFNCETAASLSEMLYLLKGRLHSAVENRVRDEIFKRVLSPFSSSPPQWWESSKMNWASVCASSIGIASIYLIEDKNALFPILKRAISALDSFLSGFSSDGACLEGMLYWNYGLGFFTYFSVLLSERTGGKINLFQDERVRKAAAFQQNFMLDDLNAASFSDSPPQNRFILGFSHRLSKLFAEITPPHFSCSSGAFGDNCFRWQHMVRNFFWSKPKSIGGLGECSCFYKDAGLFLRRTKRKNAFVSFAAKAGHNDEPHNHNDIGSFILFCSGKQILADPGSGEYTKEYFSDGRYGLIATSSRGHSVPIIDSGFQRPGENQKGKVINASHEENSSKFEIEFSKAYKNPSILHLKRTFIFDNKNLCFDLIDDFLFDTPLPATERFVTFIPPKIIGNEVFIGNYAKISVQGINISPKISEEEFLLNSPDRKKLYIIDFEIPPQKEIKAAFKIQITE